MTGEPPSPAENPDENTDPPNDTDEYMSLTEVEPLNDAETVGVVHEWERGPMTVEFTDVRSQISVRVRDDIGDDDSRLFVACEDGEMTVGYDPKFQAPIVTNLTVGQAKLALNTLVEEVGHAEPVDVLFDDAGPIIFRAGEMLTVVTPGIFPWQHASQPRQTRSPSQPSIRGESDE